MKLTEHNEESLSDATSANRVGKGFTLIELLVVIAIISILSAILFPVFARARENARRASCMSNMKQISLSWLMYVQDYDSTFPVYEGADYLGLSGSVMPLLQPYVKDDQIFVCPSRSSSATMRWSAFSLPYGEYGTDYGMAWTYRPNKAPLINLRGGGSALLLDEVSEPSLLCLVAEDNYTPIPGYGYGEFQANSPFSYVVPAAHLGGSNYAFLDGHVKWLSQQTAEIPHASNDAIHFYE